MKTKMSRSKLQKILNKLDGTNERTASAIREFEGGVKELREKLQQEISVSTLEEVNLKINKFRKTIDLNPIQNSLTLLSENFETSVNSLLNNIEQKSNELKNLTSEGDAQLTEQATQLSSEIETLKKNLDALVTSNRTELNLINNELGALLASSKTFATKDELSVTLEEGKKLVQLVEKKKDEEVKEIKENIGNFRSEFLTRLANKGGGNANRDIRVNGNSVLGKYTDFNIQNSSTIGWTTRINETLKRVDFFASVLTGGGSGTPGGSVTQVQFNDGGTFGGDAGFTYNKTTDVARVGILAADNSVDIYNGSGLNFFSDAGITNIGSFTLPAESQYNFGNSSINAVLNISSLTADRNFSAPDSDGTFGLLERTQTWSGLNTFGIQGSVVGRLTLAGSITGTTQVQPASTAGNWTLTLPPNNGTAGQYLQNLANGVTQWASVTAVGGSGITRSVSVITANTTGAEGANTDYVYIASAVGMTFTLPNAIGNTNLYVLKNFTGSSVLVAVSAGQAIDQSATALMPTMNESLSFISNSSVWAVV